MSLIYPIVCGTEYSFLNILKKIIKKDTDGNYYLQTVGLASDEVSPLPLSAEIGLTGATKLVITFDEPLNETITPLATDFATAGIFGGYQPNNVVVSGSTVILTIAGEAYYGDTITVTYTQPVLNPLQDLAGNLAASFLAMAVTTNIGLCPEYQAVVTAMTTIPGANDTKYQNTLLNYLSIKGHLAKAELIDLFAVHTNGAGEALINWKNPGTFNPDAVTSPPFVAYQGFTANSVASRYISTNFNPVANGTLIGQNNLCIILGIATNLGENTVDAGCFDGADYIFLQSRRTTNVFRSMFNHIVADDTANLGSIGHFTMSRGAAANYDYYKNTTKTNIVKASTGAVNAELYVGAMNTNGVLSNVANKQYRYFCVFSYLTEAEVLDVVYILEWYLDQIGTGLI